MLSDNSQPSAYFPLKINKSQESQAVVPLKFPSTRSILWESKHVGDSEYLSFTSGRDVRLFIVEKSLRLAYRYSQEETTCFLLGSAYVGSEEGGVCFGVDRFDPGREIVDKIGEEVTKYRVPTAVVPGDHVIPVKVKSEQGTISDLTSHTKAEFLHSLKLIESKICGKDSLTLSHIVSLKANFYFHKDETELTIKLHCGALVPSAVFKVVPIAPLPIIPTALARNLAGPLRLSDVQGTPKMGYITMDQTRKLLLLLESDPKVYGLPLIGIWLSGIQSIHHPYVWASCLRFLNCKEIKERVLHRSGSFLLLHYTVVQKIPDFWECFPENGNLDFELLNCQEELCVDLDEDCAKEPSCFLLSNAKDGSANKLLFIEALAQWKDSQHFGGNSPVNKIFPAVNRDEKPRPSPSPHPSPTQGVLLPVPEDPLSLSIDESVSKQDKTNGVRKSRPSNNGGNILAPRFNKCLGGEQHPVKPSRTPFKDVNSPNHSPSITQGRAKPNMSMRKHAHDNKENTPVRHNQSKQFSPKTPQNVSPMLKVAQNKVNPVTKKKRSVSSRPRHQITQVTRETKDHDSGTMNSSVRAESVSVDVVESSSTTIPGGTKNPRKLDNEMSEDNENSFSNETINHPYIPTETVTTKFSSPESPSRNLSNFEDDLRSGHSSSDFQEDDVPRDLSLNNLPAAKTIETDAACSVSPTPRLDGDNDFDSRNNTVKNKQSESRDVCNSNETISAPDKLIESQSEEKKHVGNGELLKQLQKQENMIRVLQEQVRSLLKLKEEISSPARPHIPLTPASTPDLDTMKHEKEHLSFETNSNKLEEKDMSTNIAIQTENGLQETYNSAVDDEQKPKCVTIGVNTGSSLLWNTCQEVDTKLSPRSQTNRCSETGEHANSEKTLMKNKNILTPDTTEDSLLEISDVQIRNVTNESVVTLGIVDIPSYVESSTAPENNQSKLDGSHVHAKLPCEKTSCNDKMEDVKGKEYYDGLLCQVKDLLTERIGCEPDVNEPTVSPILPRHTPHVPAKEDVVKATLRELEKMRSSKVDEYNSPSRKPSSSSRIFSTRQRSLSSSFIPDHVRLNYVSMTGDETFDEMSQVDEIALKYLSDKDIQEFKSEMRSRSTTRTVRFGSLPNDGESERKTSNNIKEVDFTWNNLSICTKNYLTKYNLVERHISMTTVEHEGEETKVLSNIKPQDSLDNYKPPMPSPVSKDKTQSNILDMKRLKKLPKLF